MLVTQPDPLRAQGPLPSPSFMFPSQNWKATRKDLQECLGREGLRGSFGGQQGEWEATMDRPPSVALHSHSWKSYKSQGFFSHRFGKEQEELLHWWKA